MRIPTVAFLSASLVTIVHADGLTAGHNQTESLTRQSTCLAPEWHFDFPGNDLDNTPGATYQDCCATCYNTSGCGAYTWTNFNGGTCYLKSSRAKSEWKGAMPDGSASTISAEVYRCGAISKDTDFVGQEFGNEPGASPEHCCAMCMQYRPCFGFTWTNYNGGTCWFKYGDLTPVFSPGAYSASKFRSG